MDDLIKDDNTKNISERREARRRRRIRNQILAYIVLILVLIGVSAGAIIGARHFSQGSEESQMGSQEISQENSSDDAEEDSKENSEGESSENDGFIQVPKATPQPTPEPTPEVVEPTAEEKLEQMLEELIAGMPLEDKVANLFLITPEALTGVSTATIAGDGTKKALEKYSVGGLIYFKKNIVDKEQIRKMLANTASFSKYPLFFAVDEEGGRVARVADAGIYEPVASAGDIGATGDANNAYLAGMSIGVALSELGFNVDFAPVADIANADGSVMVGRSYGSDPTVVSGFVTAMMMGLEANDVTACLKHFPGLGCTTADTHKGMAFTERTEEEFKAAEFTVFEAGIASGAKMIMVGHMSAPNLTGNSDPCIFSEKLITDILRGEMGYEGVIITDALNMGAISTYYGADEAAILALKAGCDMLLMPENFGKAYGGVLQAVLDGTIAEERIDDSLKRIYRIKYAEQLENE